MSRKHDDWFAKHCEDHTVTDIPIRRRPPAYIDADQADYASDDDSASSSDDDPYYETDGDEDDVTETKDDKQAIEIKKKTRPNPNNPTGSLVSGHAVLRFQPLKDMVDFMKTKSIPKLRKLRGITSAIKAGSDVRIQWPYLVTTHAHPIRVTVPFTSGPMQLQDLVGGIGGSVADTPVILRCNQDSLKRALRTADRKNCDFRMAPHTIRLVSYAMNGVPGSWDMSVRSTALDDSIVGWCSEPYATTNPSLLDVKCAAPLYSGVCHAHNSSPFFVADVFKLGRAAWMRWSAMDQRDIIADLESRMTKSGLFYSFTCHDDECKAPHPMVHAALRNLHALLIRARLVSDYTNLTLDDMIHLNNDGTVDLRLPVEPTNDLVKRIFATIKQEETVIELGSLSVAVFPSDGYETISNWMTKRADYPEAERNPTVSMSVCLEFVGVLLSSANNGGTDATH